jgi:hypothetical protein
MGSLDMSTVLRRAPRLRLHLESNESAKVFVGDRAFKCGPHGLAVLAAFARPATMAEAVAALSASGGAQAWVELMQTIAGLYEAGVLVDESSATPVLRDDAAGFEGAALHAFMLNDRGRTSAYLDAIREVVRPGDVVVDVGTGTGILAMAAARAGASRVYAIEAGAIGKVAETLFEANGLADRVTLVEGWSTKVELPERADVMISEIMGDEPFGEHVLEATADAVKRLLEPRARMVPRRVSLFAVPVAIPARALGEHLFTRTALGRWRSWYGFDFAPLEKISRDSLRYFFVNPYAARDWERMAEPVELVKVDFAKRRDAEIRRSRTIETTRAGRLDGVLLYFELGLGPTTTLSTDPSRVARDNHWRSPVWMLPSSADVTPGDRVALRFTYDADGSRLDVRLKKQRDNSRG